MKVFIFAKILKFKEIFEKILLTIFNILKNLAHPCFFRGLSQGVFNIYPILSMTINNLKFWSIFKLVYIILNSYQNLNFLLRE